ncbi:MAG: flagellar basal-body MS-ring/collar protein FliF, partial [Pseudomonadota bacterium]|nr:flagellar basal-body MS-ring/collar protein FliF [Pseudomonadota bacterium]
MATKALAHPVLEQINSLTSLNIVRQFGLMLVLAAAIALGTAVVMWSRDQDMSVLYPDLSPSDSSAVLAVLEQNAVPYAIDQRSGLISVPTSQVQQLRLQLASQGLPRTNASGFDMLYEESTIGTSNFLEQARYNRALELELVQTIKLIRGVRDVRVHLSIPKQSTFLRSGNKASASVMLDVVPGQIVNENQIAGIAHLVASSVAGLDTDNVSIVDQKGTLLSRRKNSEFAVSSEHLQYTRNLEAEYTQRILDILTPVIGEGRVRAQVTADLDFTTIETTEESYDPAAVVLRSEQMSEESRGQPSPQPGDLSATPPDLQPDGSVQAANATAVTPPQQSRTNATRNYEIDKSISYIRSVPGGIKRLSVAVLVDLPAVGSDAADAQTATIDAEKLARLTTLVKDTIGFSEARGDSVNVVSERFTESTLFTEEVTTPIWQEAWVPSAMKQLAATAVVLLLIFAVLRPALRSVVVAP